MIEPIDASETTEQSFTVADIENDPQGNVLAIGLSYRYGSAIKHEQLESWGKFFDRILTLGRQKKQHRTIYAHNGGGWDWLSLLEFLLKSERFRFWKIEGQRVQSKIVLLKIYVPNANGKSARFCIRFADSLYLLRSSLDKLGQKFLGSGKVNIDNRLPHEIYASDRTLFDRYLQVDCETLLRVLEQTLSLIRDRIAKVDSLGVTIGSTAMKIWRTGFLTKPIDIPQHDSVKDFLREGYRGGRVEVFKYGIFQNVSVYDVNSLYPAAMLASNVPTSHRGDWCDIIRWKLPGVYRVAFRQRNRTIPPVLLVNGTGSYEGIGTYFVPELALLRRVDSTADIRVEKGYFSYEYGKPFDEYVKSLYALRMSDKGGPVDLLAKYLLNSLYGKLAQKSRREQYLVLNDTTEIVEKLKRGERIVELSEDFGTWVEEKETKVGFEHVGIAGMITSTARVLLYNQMLSVPYRDLIYCDTDSIHVKGNHDVVTTDFIGGLKREFCGDGCYAGRKLYSLRASDGSEKTRAKGVSVGGRNGCTLNFDSLCRIIEGEKIVCRFFQPTTANETMKGMNSCTFRERTRTLRMVRK